MSCNETEMQCALWASKFTVPLWARLSLATLSDSWKFRQQTMSSEGFVSTASRDVGTSQKSARRVRIVHFGTTGPPAHGFFFVTVVVPIRIRPCGFRISASNSRASNLNRWSKLSFADWRQLSPFAKRTYPDQNNHTNLARLWVVKRNVTEPQWLWQWSESKILLFTERRLSST